MIYLDSAATTVRKPRSVARASAYAIDHVATPGRGGHRPAMEAANIAFACREEAAALFGVSEPERVVFTFNATHGLNIAIKTLVKPGATVLISGYEHNAVTRPLHAIPDVHIKVADSPLFDWAAALEAFTQKLTPEVDVVICTHVSNVFGFVLPLEAIAALCRQRKVPLIVDASQSAGCLPLSCSELGAAFIAMPGHKGLYGPQGTGLLLCGEIATPLLEGGTGSVSLSQEMPDFLPDRLEAGTHNIAGIAGLLEGLRFLRRKGVEQIGAWEAGLVRRTGEMLMHLPGVEVFRAPENTGVQAGVLSFRAEGWDCEELGEELGRRGAALRAGLHCAPLAHRTAGTLDTGTLRMSVSAFTTYQEVWKFFRILQTLLPGGRSRNNKTKLPPVR